MEEQFIPWPDYAICPNCKKKINTSDVEYESEEKKEEGTQKKRLFHLFPKTLKTTCPHCNTKVTYTVPHQKIIGLD